MDMGENDTRGESPSTQRRPIMERHLSSMVDSFLERARFSHHDGVLGLIPSQLEKVMIDYVTAVFSSVTVTLHWSPEVPPSVTTATIGHLSKIPVTLKSMKSP